jgi:hypothetical protein
MKNFGGEQTRVLQFPESPLIKGLHESALYSATGAWTCPPRSSPNPPVSSANLNFGAVGAGGGAGGFPDPELLGGAVVLPPVDGSLLSPLRPAAPPVRK